MGRNPLIIVDRNELLNQIIALLAEERSDVPREYHERDAKFIVEKLTRPSF